MRSKRFAVLVIVWAFSIILLVGIGGARPTYFVEKAMEVFNFEFPSKETYVLTINIIGWMRWFYFGVLAFLTFYLFQRQRSWQ